MAMRMLSFFMVMISNVKGFTTIPNYA
jgi:hypothetical protein